MINNYRYDGHKSVDKYLKIQPIELPPRDILKHWYFTYNGVDGSITICD